MMEDDNGSIKVTLKDVWKAQQEGTREVTAAIGDLKDAITRMTGHLDRIDTRNEIADKVAQDVESRLRALERWRYALPTAILVSAGSVAVSIVEWLSHGH